jgi:beta-glucosidase-like glycosyl hydrolase
VNIGRLVLPALRWREADGFRHEDPAIAEALAAGAGGFILFGGTREAVAELTARLREQAGRDLLIAADLERGPGQQMAGLSELPPPLALAALEDLSVIRGAGFLTAVEARAVGINWVLAPVADLDLEPENPIVQSRAFGADPLRVADMVAAWVAGCEGGGALACAKHFPGHGRTRSDSHDTLPVVEAPAEQLRGADLVPFRAAVAAGAGSLMTAHVAYPALDPAGLPATLSAPILRLARQELGFGGLIVSDALIMEGARGGRDTGEVAVAAARAGVDLLLYPEHPVAAIAALEQAAAGDRSLARGLEVSLARYDAALRSVAGPPAGGFTAPAGSTVALADWLLSRPLLRGDAPRLRAPVRVTVVDDDPGLAAPFTLPLPAAAARAGDAGSRIACVAATPRAGKGHAGLGAESRARLRAAAAGGLDLIVLFGHPRLLAELPEGPPVLLAWHRQDLMARAAARWIAERLG